MIKNIIFDFDGVIVDSEKLVAEAFCKYLKSHKIYFTEKDFSFYAGKKTYQVIDDLSNKFSIENKESFLNDIMKIVQDTFSNKLTETRGIRRFLLNEKYNFFIASNSIKKRILFGLKKVKLDNYFHNDSIISFDSVDRPKPAPDVYLAVINNHKLKKNETVIIEDSAVGVKAGFEAGIEVIGITVGGHWYKERSIKELFDAGAKVVIDDYSKLKDEINKIC